MPLSYNYIMNKKYLILTLFLVLIFKRADCLEDIIGDKVDGAYILQPTMAYHIQQPSVKQRVP